MSMKGGSMTALYKNTSRSEEIEDVLLAVIKLLVPFLCAADSEQESHISKNTLISPSSLTSSTAEAPLTLSNLLPLAFPGNGVGRDGLLSALVPILEHSVNTSAPGFLDKLYSAPSPPGIAAELILSVLNTNLHVYAVSPALSLIESSTAAQLAALFGLTPENGAPRAGGISVQGGSASNLTSIVVARNTLYPNTKREGNWKGAGCKELILFTSAHGHYSIEKAAQALGLGTSAVVSVPVDASAGMMDPAALETAITRSRERGQLPFYVNATAGTTVLGSFDPFEQIAEICRRERIWMHVDGSWGGSFIFSPRLRKSRLKGMEKADSIAINPHKMLQVPLTCSFLLGRDMRQFQEANAVQAGYLFHEDDSHDPSHMDEFPRLTDDETATTGVTATNGRPASSTKPEPDSTASEPAWEPPLDLASLTLQCGRRGDSLKMFMTWLYYGTNGLGQQVEGAYDIACHLAGLVERSSSLLLVPAQRGRKPDCLQVCFWFVGVRADQREEGNIKEQGDRSKHTGRIAGKLKSAGFMVDYAPMMEGEAEAWRGSFFRVVINLRTRRETVERLIDAVERAGEEVLQDETTR